MLSRQWKNAIYTPLMLTYSLHHSHSTKKEKMGHNVTPIPTPAAAAFAPPSASPFVPTTAQSKDLPSMVEVKRITKKQVNPETGNDDERTALLLANGGEADSSWLSSDDSSLVLNATDLNDSILPLLSGRNSTSQSSSPHKLMALKRKMVIFRKQLRIEKQILFYYFPPSFEYPSSELKWEMRQIIFTILVLPFM